MPREKTRTRKKHTGIILLLLIVILLLAGIACWLGLQVYQRAEPALVGSWRMRLDLTEQASLRANAWLRDAQLGEQVDAAENMPPLCVNVHLILGEDGTWSRRVEAESLEAAQRQACEALAQSLRELLAKRIEAAGRKAESPADMEAHVQAALGMGTEQYLSQYGPHLLPTAAELQARYDGSGSYEVAGQHIRFDGQEAVNFLAGTKLLTFSGAEGTEVYER